MSGVEREGWAVFGGRQGVSRRGAYNVPLVLDRVYPHRVACHFQQSTKREDGHVPGLVPVKGEVGDVETGEEIEDQKEDGGWQGR